METAKFPVESVVPPPTCAPIVPLVMAKATTWAPLTGPFTTVPLTVPIVGEAGEASTASAAAGEEEEGRAYESRESRDPEGHGMPFHRARRLPGTSLLLGRPRGMRLASLDWNQSRLVRFEALDLP